MPILTKMPDNTAETVEGALAVPCAFGSQLNSGSMAALRPMPVKRKANGRFSNFGSAIL